MADDVAIANNLIFSSQDPLFGGDEGTNFTYEGNIAFGDSLVTTTGQSGISVVDPLLVAGAGGLLRPTSNSPAINAAQGDYSSSTGNIDIDGQPRVGVADVGADEFAAAIATLAPLTGADVGHCFFDVPPDTGGGDGSGTNISGGLILQANKFTSALDPNGDGDTFTVVASSNSFGGTVSSLPKVSGSTYRELKTPC